MLFTPLVQLGGSIYLAKSDRSAGVIQRTSLCYACLDLSIMPHQSIASSSFFSFFFFFFSFFFFSLFFFFFFFFFFFPPPHFDLLCIFHACEKPHAHAFYCHIHPRQDFQRQMIVSERTNTVISQYTLKTHLISKTGQTPTVWTGTSECGQVPRVWTCTLEFRQVS